ncbi:MAG: rod shape-determining protein MreD [Pseudomonadota bacterium]
METDAGLQAAPARAMVMLAALGFGCFVIQTIFHTWAGPFGYGPDLFILLTLYLGLYAPLASGAALSAGLGFLLDAGGGILGYNAFNFYIVFIIVFFIRQNLDPSGPWFLTLFSLVFSLLGNGLAYLMLNIFGKSFLPLSLSWSSPLTTALVSSLATAAVCPLAFKFLDFFRAIGGSKPESD